jgi:16S rRNA (guanine966-N2)-methyltransferase
MLTFPVFFKHQLLNGQLASLRIFLMPKSPNQYANSLRIIGGKWRSRKLSFPDVEGLRPTSDRVRETLFNWLQEIIAREDCLDLFAGSGACGLEALSRGARHVSFVDSSAKATEALKVNLKSLGADNFALYCQDAVACVKGLASKGVPTEDGRYGLVFLDPPFASTLLEEGAKELEGAGILRENAFIYVESAKEISPSLLPDNWHMLKSKKAGKVYFGLYQRRASDQH